MQEEGPNLSLDSIRPRPRHLRRQPGGALDFAIPFVCSTPFKVDPRYVNHFSMKSEVSFPIIDIVHCDDIDPF